MTREENLMVIAMEECAEIQQEISKALRFGVDNHHPNEPDITNGERILKEFHQLRAVMDMLIINRIIQPISESKQSEIYRDKVSAVEGWQEYSQEIGRVN